MKISNGKWMWWSRGIGGKSALDYLIKVQGLDFVEVAETILGKTAKQNPRPIPAEKENDLVHLFESAIDLLSYGTLQKLCGKEWRAQHLLSLAGVYQPAKQIEESKVPAALASFLKGHSEVKTIVLHLDNDKAGRRMAQALKAALPSHYLIRDRPPPQGKDCNDYLCLKLGRQLTKRMNKDHEVKQER